MNVKEIQMSEFTHLDEKGRVRMVDVSEKDVTSRTAIATGSIRMTKETFEAISNNTVTKGNVLETARIAGIMAAKKTSELIPMCHPLAITHASVKFEPDPEALEIHIQAEVRIRDRTGVEMEALTAVSVAALTIYDMCKSYDKGMVISNISLMEKTGGKSGRFRRE